MMAGFVALLMLSATLAQPSVVRAAAAPCDSDPERPAARPPAPVAVATRVWYDRDGAALAAKAFELRALVCFAFARQQVRFGRAMPFVYATVDRIEIELGQILAVEKVIQVGRR